MIPKPEPRRKKRPNPGHPYLAWLKTQPCAACRAAAPSEAAHVRGPISLKTGLPLPRRADTAYLAAVPLCSSCHRDGPGSIHELGEMEFSIDQFGNEYALAGLAHSYLARWILNGRKS
jgi:hypothetical protein